MMQPDAAEPLAAGLPAEYRPCRRSDVVCQSSGAKTLIYARVADTVYELNMTAWAVWQLCDGQHSAADMEAHLRSHFRNTSGKDIATDLSILLELLQREALIGPGAQSLASADSER